MKRLHLSRPQLLWVGLAIACLLLTLGGLRLMGGYNPAQLQRSISQAGAWAPLLYILAYTVGTLTLLPSTPLNISGGLLFGAGFGILWTSLGAILAAAIAFWFSRTIGRSRLEKRLAGRWQRMDAEIQRGGLFYMFAIRLVPIMPYGIVNFAAGLTSIRFRDFLTGTLLGTVPSVLPFVLIGSSGFSAMTTGNQTPLVGALGLTGLLMLFSAWVKSRGRLKA